MIHHAMLNQVEWVEKHQEVMKTSKYQIITARIYQAQAKLKLI